MKPNSHFVFCSILPLYTSQFNLILSPILKGPITFPTSFPSSFEIIGVDGGTKTRKSNSYLMIKKTNRLLPYKSRKIGTNFGLTHSLKFFSLSLIKYIFVPRFGFVQLVLFYSNSYKEHNHFYQLSFVATFFL